MPQTPHTSPIHFYNVFVDHHPSATPPPATGLSHFTTACIVVNSPPHPCCPPTCPVLFSTQQLKGWHSFLISFVRRSRLFTVPGRPACSGAAGPSFLTASPDTLALAPLMHPHLRASDIWSARKPSPGHGRGWPSFHSHFCSHLIFLSKICLQSPRTQGLIFPCFPTSM